MNDKLRERVKILKAKGQVRSYKIIAEFIEISQASFYNWLNGYYQFGE